MKAEIPTLQEGDLYLFQHGELRHIERSPNEFPKVSIAKVAHARLLELRRRCRSAPGGFRPDEALVASALIEHGVSSKGAEVIVAAYFSAAVARRHIRELCQESRGGCRG